MVVVVIVVVVVVVVIVVVIVNTISRKPFLTLADVGYLRSGLAGGQCSRLALFDGCKDNRIKKIRSSENKLYLLQHFLKKSPKIGMIWVRNALRSERPKFILTAPLVKPE